MVEWSRALDERLSEWCCSVSMVWVQIPSREEQNLTALKSNSNTVWFNFHTDSNYNTNSNNHTDSNYYTNSNNHTDSNYNTNSNNHTN